MLASPILWLLNVVHLVITIYIWIIIVRALISWVSPDPFNPVVRFLYRATEPVLRPIRRLMPDLGGIDISPVILMIGLIFLEKLIYWLYFQLFV